MQANSSPRGLQGQKRKAGLKGSADCKAEIDGCRLFLYLPGSSYSYYTEGSSYTGSSCDGHKSDGHKSDDNDGGVRGAKPKGKAQPKAAQPKAKAKLPQPVPAKEVPEKVPEQTWAGVVKDGIKKP